MQVHEILHVPADTADPHQQNSGSQAQALALHHQLCCSFLTLLPPADVCSCRLAQPFTIMMLSYFAAGILAAPLVSPEAAAPAAAAMAAASATFPAMPGN